MEEYATDGGFKTVCENDLYRFNWEIENFHLAIGTIGNKSTFLDAQRVSIQVGRNIGYVTKWDLFLSCVLERNREHWIELHAVHHRDKDDKPQQGGQYYASLEIVHTEGCSAHQQKASIKICANSAREAIMKVKLFKTSEQATRQRLQDNRNKIKFSIRFALSTSSYDDIGIMAQEEEEERKRFLTNIAGLISADAHPGLFDLKIRVTRSNNVLRAHRPILSARSTVFAKMLEDPTFTGQIDIDDLSEQAVEVLLHFVYTCTMRDDWGDVVGEIIYGADKYKLSGLIGLINRELINVCNAGNAQQLLDIVAMHNGLAKAKSDIQNLLEAKKRSDD